MKVVVLGGLGLQGRAALVDLSRSADVDEIICADANLDGWNAFSGTFDSTKIVPLRIDATSPEALLSVLEQGVDVAIDLLPLTFMLNIFEAAIKAKVPLVSTNYAHSLHHLHAQAEAAGITLMPECGLDPGIDLIIYGHAVKQFDEVSVLKSYGGGIPEKSACDNPLNYKVTWNWDMVLRSTKRDSFFIRNGHRLIVSAAEQHEKCNIHNISVPGIGELEAIPNGDAVAYTDLLGITETIQETGRYALRWPGWCDFWRPLKKLGFLSSDLLNVSGCQVSPHDFLVSLIEPQIQFQEGEKDIVILQNIFEGKKAGKKKRLVANLLIERDLETGLFAMNMGVSYPTTIVAQMIVRGEITRRGLLSPVLDIPHDSFMAELSKRGIKINYEMTDLN
ncbi:MAG: saccharopine dehydrogenase [Deltaproteobacteria bacterium]|nr:saccharopine dehydrogenase [Deltaproteobacteria bacterium]